MIRTGITYRFKQRVTEAGIFPGFFTGPPGVVALPRGGSGAENG